MLVGCDPQSLACDGSILLHSFSFTLFLVADLPFLGTKRGIYKQQESIKSWTPGSARIRYFVEDMKSLGKRRLITSSNLMCGYDAPIVSGKLWILRKHPKQRNTDDAHFQPIKFQRPIVSCKISITERRGSVVDKVKIRGERKRVASKYQQTLWLTGQLTVFAQDTLLRPENDRL